MSNNLSVTSCITTPDLDIWTPPDNLPKKIPIETIIAYRRKGLSINDIATIVGCSKQNVWERLQTVGYDDVDLDSFNNSRADILAFVQSKLINSLDSDAIKEMQPYQRVVATGILYDKERLERGKSTSNINVVEVTGTIADLQAQASKLRESL